ncbi:MAG: hypothetical protein ACOY3X_02235 [Pseudomonadota bacterium]
MKGKKKTSAEVVDLVRSREALETRRQERAEAELASRFHDAMGWKGTADRSGGKKKPKRKKR